MHWLPGTLALLTALVVAHAGLRALSAGGLEAENYRGRRLPLPAGAIAVAAAGLALIPIALIERLAGADLYPDDLGIVAIYALGVGFLGLLDDALDAEPRGWRGHGAAVLSGGLSTGALKAAGSLGLALFALGGYGDSDAEYLLAVVVVVVATNLFNLLDLRPGRSAKAFVLLGAGLLLGTLETEPLAAVALFAGPLLVLGFFDLRERAMLGDTGSNLLGGLAGLWIVLSLGTTGQGIALAAMILMTIYGEFRSISSWVEKTPLVRDLDSLGRPR